MRPFSFSFLLLFKYSCLHFHPTFLCYKFPFKVASYKFCYVIFSFLFGSMYFLKFLLRFHFEPMDYLEVCCLVFKCSDIFLLLFISCLISLWWRNTVNFISVFKNLLWFVLWHRTWSNIVCVPWALEKNVYYSVVGWSVL